MPEDKELIGYLRQRHAGQAIRNFDQTESDLPVTAVWIADTSLKSARQRAD